MNTCRACLPPPPPPPPSPPSPFMVAGDNLFGASALVCRRRLTPLVCAIRKLIIAVNYLRVDTKVDAQLKRPEKCFMIPPWKKRDDKDYLPVRRKPLSNITTRPLSPFMCWYNQTAFSRAGASAVDFGDQTQRRLAGTQTLELLHYATSHPRI